MYDPLHGQNIATTTPTTAIYAHISGFSYRTDNWIDDYVHEPMVYVQRSLVCRADVLKEM